MRTTTLALLIMSLLLAACGQEANKTEPVPTGESAAGLAIGSTFDGKPLTIGSGELKGKAVVISYFATW